MAIETILNGLQDYIEYQLDEGNTSAEMTPEILEKLKTPMPQPPQTHSNTSTQTGKDHAADLDAIKQTIASCTKCSLHETRTKVVPGQGSAHPEIMFIGEAPGADEDKQGQAFVGRAGKLLTKMIVAMGYTRDEVFIGNILKCRPPDNRKPMPDEMDTCMPYLKQQITTLQPKVIIALGATAVQGLLQTSTGISKLRGTWMTFEGIPFMPTYHPAYLLRNPSAKKDVWNDLKAVLKHLGRKPPKQEQD